MRSDEKLSEEKKINISKVQIVTPIIIDGKITEAEDAVLIKNTSSTISEILGCTRQNVETIMKRGNANKIRELDFMALQFVEKMYGGAQWI